MCCRLNKTEIDKLKAKYPPGTKFAAWKCLDYNGSATIGVYQYAPGIHQEIVGEYNEIRPRGFHVYLHEPPSVFYPRRVYLCSDVWIPVVVCIDDLIRVGDTASFQEAVFSKIEITQETWDYAFSIKPNERLNERIGNVLQT